MSLSPHLWSLLHSIYPPLPSDLPFSFLKYKFLLQNIHCLAEKLLLSPFIYFIRWKINSWGRHARHYLIWPEPAFPASRLHHVTHTSATTKSPCSFSHLPVLARGRLSALGVLLAFLHVENCFILHDSTERSLSRRLPNSTWLHAPLDAGHPSLTNNPYHNVLTLFVHVSVSPNCQSLLPGREACLT